jgi:H+/gluconate symporter-like permease
MAGNQSFRNPSPRSSGQPATYNANVSPLLMRGRILAPKGMFFLSFFFFSFFKKKEKKREEKNGGRKTKRKIVEHVQKHQPSMVKP